MLIDWLSSVVLFFSLGSEVEGLVGVGISVALVGLDLCLGVGRMVRLCCWLES